MRRARLKASADAGPTWALGLSSSGSRPKGHGTHNAPLFFRLEDYALLVGEKYCVSRP